MNFLLWNLKWIMHSHSVSDSSSDLFIYLFPSLCLSVGRFLQPYDSALASSPPHCINPNSFSWLRLQPCCIHFSAWSNVIVERQHRQTGEDQRPSVFSFFFLFFIFSSLSLIPLLISVGVSALHMPKISLALMLYNLWRWCIGLQQDTCGDQN